jgi:tetratricopeptide (TPR) repeat protein
MPDSPRLLRAFARSIGERAGSLEMRRRLLARAERIDYDLAVRENDAGNPDAALKLLDGIHYYAALSGERDVEPEILKHGLLRKEALLNRAKARLMKSRRIEDAEADLRAYLEIEDKFNEVLALESFLREISVLREESFVRPNFNDLRRLAFEMFLMFKLNKYEGITALGEVIRGGVFVAAGAQKRFLVEIYSLIADAYDKLNFIYEPEEFYLKALELEPGSRMVLLKLKRYYDRLNEKGKLAETERALNATLSPEVRRLPDGLIPKGGSRSFDLALLPGPARLTLVFIGEDGRPGPLTTVLFDNRVVWEDFPAGPGLSLDVEAGRSADRLTVSAVNRPLRLLELRWAPVPQN